MRARVLMVLLACALVVGCSTGMRPMMTDPKAPKIKVFKKLGKIKTDPDIPIANRRDGIGPVTITWSAKPGDKLDIIFDKDTGCVDLTSKKCSGNTCTYLTDVTLRVDRVCDYSISLNDVKQDPILVIDDNGR